MAHFSHAVQSFDGFYGFLFLRIFRCFNGRLDTRRFCALCHGGHGGHLRLHLLCLHSHGFLLSCSGDKLTGDHQKDGGHQHDDDQNDDKPFTK